MEAKGLEAELFTRYEKERLRLSSLNSALSGIYSSPVFGEGNTSPSLMLVGEAPGAEEVRLGRPFVGKAGKQLDELLRLSGLSRQDIFITNAVKFRPVSLTRTGMRNRTPSAAEVNRSLYLLREEIELLRPRFIATLGNTPLRAVMKLSGHTAGVIGETHGQAIELTIAGGAIEHGARTPALPLTLYPMYHPASVIYNRTLTDICEADARGLGRLVNNG